MTHQQRIAAHVLADGGSHSEASRACGASIRTIQRWRRASDRFDSACRGEAGAVTTTLGAGAATEADGPDAIELPEVETSAIWIYSTGDAVAVIGSRLVEGENDDPATVRYTRDADRALAIRDHLARELRPPDDPADLSVAVSLFGAKHILASPSPHYIVWPER